MSVQRWPGATACVVGKAGRRSAGGQAAKVGKLPPVLVTGIPARHVALRYRSVGASFRSPPPLRAGCRYRATSACQQAGSDISDPSTCMPAEADKAKQQRLLREKVASSCLGLCCELAAPPRADTPSYSCRRAVCLVLFAQTREFPCCGKGRIETAS